MRKTFSLLIVALTAAHLSAQSPVRMEKAGLISELAYIKYVAENQLSTVLSDPRPLQLDGLATRPENMKRDEYTFQVDSLTAKLKEERRINAQPVIQAYLNLKVLSDQWNLQLQADLRRRNGRKPYKVLDDQLKDASLAVACSSATQHSSLYYLGRIQVELEALNTAVNVYMNGAPMAALGEIGIPTVADIAGIFLGMAERRKAKADDLVGLLSAMRLSAPSELGASGASAKESDEEK